MAKKPTKTIVPLSFADLVLGADAETLRAALEARLQIDGLLAERDAAYRRIAELETRIDAVMGEPGAFIFPPPPCPVAGFDDTPAKPAPKGGAKKPAAGADETEAEGTESGDNDEDETAAP